MSTTHDIQFALKRINRVLAPKKAMGHRDIRLGLDRIRRAVPDKQEWQGVHVGGTNGKGSICAFLGGLFKLSGIGYGSFISPAFPEKHNGVSINGQYVNPRQYETEMQVVQSKWDRIASGWQLHHGEDPEILSPFELETATAFRLFNQLRVPYGIVEVGMGGATDATNAMKHKAVTVISKIGLDHQEYLGNTIEKIAKVKAGIMQRNVPCIVDHTNQPSVIRVLREHAREVGTDLILTWKAEPFLMSLNNEKWKLESYQIQNLLCAALAFRHMFPSKEINLDKLMATDPFMPGRLEKVELLPEIPGGEPKNVLVDGAHNMLGVEALVNHVDNRIRQSDKPITWVMGMSSSKTKPFDEIIDKIVRPQDNLAFVEFAPAPNQPPPAPANFGSDLARAIVKTPEQVYDGQPEIKSALKWACEKAGQGPVVVTGSLYLIKDLYKLDGIKRTREVETRRSTSPVSERTPKPAQEAESSEEDASESSAATNTEELAVGQQKQEAIRKSSFHGRQAKHYRTLKSVIQTDIDAAKEDGQELDESLKNLAACLKDLDEQAAKHEETYTAIRLAAGLPEKSSRERARAKDPFRAGAHLNPSPDDKPAGKRSSWGGSMIHEVARQAAAEQSKSPEQLDAEKQAAEEAAEEAAEVARQAKKEAEQSKKEVKQEVSLKPAEESNVDPFDAMKGARRDSSH